MRNISEKQSIEEVEVCEGNHQHQLEYLKNRMPTQQEMETAAELFKMFGDPTRLKLLKCVYVISAICLAFPNRRYLTSFACFVQAIWLKTAGKENRFFTRWTMNTLLPF